MGFIYLHRELKRCSFYRESDCVHLWTHLLLTASHSDHEYRMGDGSVVVLAPGQLITGRQALSRETGIDERRVRTILTRFEREGMIEATATGRKFTRIRIVKLADYQVDSDEKNRPRKSQAKSQETANANADAARAASEVRPNNGHTIGQETAINNKGSQEYIETDKSVSCTSRVVGELLLRDGVFEVTEDYLAECVAAYPAIDVLCEFRRMAQWLDANPRKRKTAVGVRRFVTSWLGRARPAPVQQGPYDDADTGWYSDLLQEQSEELGHA